MNTALRALKAVCVAAVLLMSTGAAMAQQACVLRETAVPQLQKQFEEQIVGRGLTPNGKAMFELFVSQSGTWTVLVSDTDGRSCIVASGASWQRVPLVLGDPA